MLLRVGPLRAYVFYFILLGNAGKNVVTRGLSLFCNSQEKDVDDF